MSVAALEAVLLTLVLSVKQFSILLLRVLPERRLWLLGASSRYSPGPPGEGLPCSVHTVAACISSVSSRHSLPYRFLFSKSKLHILSRHGRCCYLPLNFYPCCPLCQDYLKASRQKQTNRQGAPITPYSPFRTQIVWHTPCPPFPPSPLSPLGCACLLDSSPPIMWARL